MKARSVEFKRGIGSKRSLNVGFEGNPEMEMSYYEDLLGRISPETNSYLRDDGTLRKDLYELVLNYPIYDNLYHINHMFTIKRWAETSGKPKFIMKHKDRIIKKSDDFRDIMVAIINILKNNIEDIISTQEYKLHKLNHLNYES